MRRLLVLCLLSLLCGSVHAQTGVPPSGLMVGSGYKMSNYMRIDTVRFTFLGTGGTFTIYVPATGNDRLNVTTSQDTIVVDKPLLGTSAHFTGTVTMGTATYVPISGNTNILGNLLGASNSLFGSSGFRLPYQATTGPSGEGQAIWNSYYDRLNIGNGSTTSIIYPTYGTPADGSIPIWNPTGVGRVDWTLYRIARALDVDTTARGNGKVIAFNTATGKNEYVAASAGTADSIVVFRTDYATPTGTVLGNMDTLYVDTTATAADGNDTLLACGVTRDTLFYTGTSQLLFLMYDNGDSTVITPGANSTLKVIGDMVIYDNLSVAGLIRGSSYVGSGAGTEVVYGGDNGYDVTLGLTGFGAIHNLNFGVTAGYQFRFYDGSTQRWGVDTDSLFGRGVGLSFLKRVSWAGDTIPPSYIGRSGATYGQVLGWDGTKYAPRSAGGLWLYNTDSTIHAYSVGGDTAIAIKLSAEKMKIMSGRDTTEIGGSVCTKIVGGAGTPSISYNSLGAIDSAWVDSAKTVVRATTIQDLKDGTIATDLVNTAHPWADNEVANDITINLASDADTTGTRIAAALADRANVHDTLTKSFVIPAVAETDDYRIGLLDIDAVTILAVRAYVDGGTNVVGCLIEYDGSGANGADCNSSDWTFNAGYTRTTSVSNASIDAGDWIGWRTTSVSGSPTALTIVVEYYK